MALQKQASDAQSRAATIAIINTKWSDATLATNKAIFNNFMSEVHGKMESQFEKQTIQKMAASVAKSIITSEHRFTKGAKNMPLPPNGDSDLHEIDRDKFQRHYHLPPPPPLPRINNPGDFEFPSTLSS
jgi:hypothetical protein